MVNTAMVKNTVMDMDTETRNDKPLVSVLLPVYNAQDTVVEAIQSILAQTYTHFELVVINDGSTDATRERILSVRDDRIRYYENEGNQGLVYTLNRGIDLCRGKYIARMDADDISLPTRFEKQVEVMEKSPNIIVCGTDISFFGDPKRVKRARAGYICFSSPDVFRQILIVITGFAHPAVMMRKSILDKYHLRYDADYPCAEDYKFWMDLAPYGDFYNISEKLLMYRLSDRQISRLETIRQKESTRKCRWSFLQKSLSTDMIELLKEGIDLNKIRSVKKESDNIYICQALYASFSRFGLKEWLYYILSGDAFRLRLSFSYCLLIKQFHPESGISYFLF